MNRQIIFILLLICCGNRVQSQEIENGKTAREKKTARAFLTGYTADLAGVTILR